MAKRPAWTMDDIRARSDEVGDCLIWNGSICNNGYPRCHCDGDTRQLRPFVYGKILGKELRAGYRVSTRCGSKLCLSEHCLVIRSNKLIATLSAEKRMRNPISMQRCREGAKRAGHAKFDSAMAEEIRSAPGTRRERAQRYGCDESTIGRLDRRDSYGTAPVATSVFEWRGQA